MAPPKKTKTTPKTKPSKRNTARWKDDAVVDPHEHPRWVFHPGNPQLIRLAQTYTEYKYLKKNGYRLVSINQIRTVIKRIFKKPSWRMSKAVFAMRVSEAMRKAGEFSSFPPEAMRALWAGDKIPTTLGMLEAFAVVLKIPKTRLYSRQKDPPCLKVWKVEYNDPQNKYRASWMYVLAPDELTATQHAFDLAVFPYGRPMCEGVDLRRGVVFNCREVRDLGTAVELENLNEIIASRKPWRGHVNV